MVTVTALSDLAPAALDERLAGPGLGLGIGPFHVLLRAPLPGLAAQIQRLYGAYPLHHGPFYDIHVGLHRPRSARRWWRAQVVFEADGERPFLPFPLDHALPLFEWGLNWCVASRAHQYLMLHAGVLARGDDALLLPGWPGSGKSTLSAALAHGGWRLLSDEFALLCPQTLQAWPFPRPIALKNASIEVLQGYAADARLGPVFPRTRKGRVAHCRAPDAAVAAMQRPAVPRWLVFPRFRADAPSRLTALPPGRALLNLGGNAFNYELLGRTGFEAAAALVERCPARLLSFASLDEAVMLVEGLTVADEPNHLGAVQ